ncbi:unnamed protein product [Toxocara canis]|uniref:Uncharacterized protein n=1 Tax=Toxocara canis TaxID=6265 RepID=A0A3P7IVB2_TOXCA|nr:unnamed protein product [Toxocara canis]
MFKDVNDFTTAHPKEIVLIDLNHFYEFKETQHEKLLTMIDSIFGNKLIDRPGTPRLALSFSLNKLWSAPGQVIVFYRPILPSPSPNSINGHAGPSDVIKLPNYVWSRQFIKNPWPRTDEPRRMVEEACQAIVTLTVNSVIRQPTGTFEARYARRATRTLVDWLRENGYNHRSNTNIIVADFVDEEDFCRAIIDLNR